jgi:hypothetical protein
MHGKIRQGMARPGKARQGKEMNIIVRLVKAGQGRAR